MKFSILLIIFLSEIFYSDAASAKDDCPDLNGRYSVQSLGPVFIDAGKLLKFNLFNFTSGQLQIKGNVQDGLSFLWKNEKDVAMPSTASSEWKFKKDYKCKDGWVVFFHKPPSVRNDVPGLYEGEATIRISRDDLYEGLKIESIFTGHEAISLFSYDSANISVSKWWARKTLRETIVLSTAPVNSMNQEINNDSRAISEVRKMFNDRVLGGLILAGVDERADAVLVTLKALRAGDLTTFEDRLRAASIPYQMTTKPVWTNNSYFLELLVKTKN
jgi:hypothetical protein